MIFYTVYEGRTKNDNDMVTNYRKRERAIEAAKKSKYAYAVVHQYEGPTFDDFDYTDTVYEKGPGQ